MDEQVQILSSHKNFLSEFGDKLNSQQKKQLHLNMARLAFNRNSQKDAGQFETLAGLYHDNDEEFILIQAAKESLSKAGKISLSKVGKWVDRYPDHCSLRILQLQACIDDNQFEKCVELIDDIKNAADFVKIHPLADSLLVWVCQIRDNPTRALETLKRITNGWEDINTALLVAKLELKAGNTNVAVDVLEELVRNDPGDKLALASLILALADTDLVKAQEYLAHLDIEIEQGDIEQLKAGPNIPNAINERTKKSVHRKRKPLPKDYDAERIPDEGFEC